MIWWPGWTATGTSRCPRTSNPIRVGFLSRHPLEVLDALRVFAAGLAPIQLSDPGPDGTLTSATQAGRGALAVRIQPPGGRPLQVVCCHLKSKLLSFPGPHGTTRFGPHDEGERAPVASYALFRRTAEAAMVRGLADRLLTADGQDGRTTPAVVLDDLNDEPAAATTQILYGPRSSWASRPCSHQERRRPA